MLEKSDRMRSRDGGDVPMSVQGEFPWFVDEMRKINGSRFTPLSYVNHDVGIPYVVAAQWLYLPQFLSYRGALLRIVRPGGLVQDNLQNVDNWFDVYDGKLSTVERTSNSLALWGLFVGSNTNPYEDDLSGLAIAIARIWDAQLRVKFAGRSFRVEVLDNDEYGAQISFYSMESSGAVESGSDQIGDGCDELRVSSPDDFPWFVNELRDINGPGFTPLSYINMDEAIPYVIASQWLYVPRFVEYRGGVFRAVHPGGVVEENLGVLDDWFEAYGGDVSSVERTVNTLTLWDLFAGVDTGPYEADLSAMAGSVARAWDALLRVEFPDREFRVQVLDGEVSGPQVTFFSGEPSGAWVPKVVEFAVNRNPDGSVRGTSENGIVRPATPDEIP